jgi:hypothetical protein
MVGDDVGVHIQVHGILPEDADMLRLNRGPELALDHSKKTKVCIPTTTITRLCKN